MRRVYDNRRPWVELTKIAHLVILNIELLRQSSFPLCQRFGDHGFSETIDNLTKGLDKIFFELQVWSIRPASTI